jgi:hypothetical protein
MGTLDRRNSVFIESCCDWVAAVDGPFCTPAANGQLLGKSSLPGDESTGDLTSVTARGALGSSAKATPIAFSLGFSDNGAGLFSRDNEVERFETDLLSGLEISSFGVR